jgi:hypothetical protein
VFGNFLVAYLTVLSCRLMDRVELLWAALLIPAYWVMMAIAAVKALWQLVATPTFWEKTVHGLDLGHSQEHPVDSGSEGAGPRRLEAPASA